MRADEQQRHSLIAQYGQFALAVVIACLTGSATSAGVTAWIMSGNEKVGAQSRAEISRYFDKMQQEITEDRQTLNSHAIDLAKQGADLSALHEAATNLTASIKQLTDIMGDTNANLKQLTQKVQDMNQPVWAARPR